MTGIGWPDAERPILPAEERDEIPPLGLDRADAHLKARRALQEELALLRKEEAETRQVDLLLVGLDLREVGAVARVEEQR